MGDIIEIIQVEFIQGRLFQIDIRNKTKNEEYRLFVGDEELSNILVDAKMRAQTVKCDKCAHGKVCRYRDLRNGDTVCDSFEESFLACNISKVSEDEARRILLEAVKQVNYMYADQLLKSSTKLIIEHDKDGQLKFSSEVE